MNPDAKVMRTMNSNVGSEDGITKREHFSEKFMSAFISAHATESSSFPTPETAAIFAIAYADALIEGLSLKESA